MDEHDLGARRDEGRDPEAPIEDHGPGSYDVVCFFDGLQVAVPRNTVV